MSRPVEPSMIHRLWNIPLGQASERYYRKNPDDCIHARAIVGTLSIGPGVIGILGLVYGFARSPIWLMIGAVGLVLAGWFWSCESQFEERERFARARIRRGECLHCGKTKNDSADVTICRACRKVT